MTHGSAATWIAPADETDHDYVREHWSRWVEVVAIHEAAAPPTQDIAVLRPR